jgi:phage terminase large subunit-like protein
MGSKEMKLLDDELSDWKEVGDNWWRFNMKNGNIVIGLRIQSRGAKIRVWHIDGYNTTQLISMLTKKGYHFNELEQVKQEIDNAIIRVNKMKCFL